MSSNSYTIKYGTNTITPYEGNTGALNAPAQKIYNLNTSNQFNSIGYGGTMYYKCNGGDIKLSKDNSTRVDSNQIKTIIGTESDMQGDCPSGFHIPTRSEMIALFNAGEDLGVWDDSDIENFSTYLKIPVCGILYGNKEFDSSITGLWCCDKAFSNAGYCLGIQSGTIIPNAYLSTISGMNIRPFKNTSKVPDHTWTTLYQGTGNAGIFHKETLGIISISANGSNWITISDKNVGAGYVYNYGDAFTEDNCGWYYQWGNCFPIPRDGGTVHLRNNQIDASDYGPGNYFSGAFFFINESGRDSSNNENLWGGVSQGTTTYYDTVANIGLADVSYGTGANNGGTSVNNPDQYFTYANNLDGGNTHSGKPHFVKTPTSLAVRGGGGAGAGGDGALVSGGEGVLVTTYPTANTKMGRGGDAGQHSENALGTTDTPGDTGIGYGGGGGGAWDTAHMSAGNKGIVCVSYNVDGSDGIDFNNTFGGQKIIKGGKVYHLFTSNSAFILAEDIISYRSINNAQLSGTSSATLSNYYDECLEFSLDGMHYYTSNNATSNGPYQVDLTVPRDVTSSSTIYDLHSTLYYGSNWNGNGTPHRDNSGMVFWNCYGNTLKKYSVSEQWNARTATVTNTYTNSIGGKTWGDLLGRGWKFCDNGRKIVSQHGFGSDQDICYVLNLSIPYDITSMDTNSYSYNSSIQGGDADYYFSNNGLHLYFVYPDVATVRHYTLTTPRDVSTATLTETVNVSGSASGIYLYGDKMYIKYRDANVKQFTVQPNYEGETFILYDETNLSQGTVDGVNGKIIRPMYGFGGGNGNYSVGTKDGYAAVLITQSHGNCYIGLGTNNYNEWFSHRKVKIVIDYFEMGSLPSAYTNSISWGANEYFNVTSSGITLGSDLNGLTLSINTKYMLEEIIDTSTMLTTLKITKLSDGTSQTISYTKTGFMIETNPTYIINGGGPAIFAGVRDNAGDGCWFGNMHLYYCD